MWKLLKFTLTLFWPKFRESKASLATMWESREKHDHHFYGKITIFPSNQRTAGDESLLTSA